MGHKTPRGGPVTERGELRRLIEQAMHLADPDEEMNYVELTLAALRALDAEGLVVVACPPGGRVVVDRTPKPCTRCNGRGYAKMPPGYDDMAPMCGACDGSGVVEATTIHGLEVADEWHIVKSEPPALYRLAAAVALPEETPDGTESPDAECCGHAESCHELVVVNEHGIMFAFDFFEDIPEELDRAKAEGRAFLACAVCDDTCGAV